jgi:hypothetical protein
VAEKLAAFATAEFFADHRARADFAAFQKLMKRRGGNKRRRRDAATKEKVEAVRRIVRIVESEEGTVKTNSGKAMMILIAGPYRSGTGDDPELIQKNVELMESYALPIFRAGHIPVLGEWLALPLVALAGSRRIGDEAFNEVFHPIAVRFEEKCDAVLRVGGASAGADEMVRVGESLGLKIYRRLEEIPGVG